MESCVRLVAAGKYIVAFTIDYADMHVQSIAGMFKHRLGDKTGVYAMLFGNFNHGSLEQTGFVSGPEHVIVMIEIYLELARPQFR
jgi:hypothetical protein